MPGSIPEFLYSQFFVSLPKPSGSYNGKTVLVTGSNTGLGKEAARHFVQLGASSVILAVRSIEKGEAAKSDIETTTKCAKDVIKIWNLDMSSYESVIQFSSRVEKEVARLNIAVLNAGVVKGNFEIFEQDEATITVNVVSTILLTLLLLPKLQETATRYNTRPTLTLVDSEVHYWAKFNERHGASIFDELRKNNGKPDMGERYYTSKLLLTMAMRAITDRKPTSQMTVTINAVNPGFCHS